MVNNKSKYYRKIKTLTSNNNLERTIKWVGSTTVQMKKYYKQVRKIIKRKRRLLSIVNQSIDERKQRLLESAISNGRINDILTMVLEDDTKLNMLQIRRVWNSIQSSSDLFNLKFVHSDGRIQYVALNDTTKEDFIRLLEQGPYDEDFERFGSDILTTYNFVDLKSITIEKFEFDSQRMRKIKNKDGAFFPYINTTNINLSRYQIYDQEQAYDDDTNEEREHCLFHTLKLFKINEALINSIKMSLFNKNQYGEYIQTNIKKKELKNIANVIDRNINLYYIDSNENTSKIQKNVIYCNNEKQERFLNLAIYENHYFKYENSNYSKISIDKYNQLCELPNFNDITKIRKRKNKVYYTRTRDRKVNSLLMIHKLHKQGHFKKLDLCKFKESGQLKETRDHIYLENIDNEQREVERPKDKKTKNRLVYYADCETYVNGPFHELQLLGFVSEKDDFTNIYNVNDFREYEDCTREQTLVYKWLKTMTKNGKNEAKCYFHNLKYDYHVLEPYINITDKCIKDGQVYSVTLQYKKSKIVLVDSYKLLPFALSKFNGNFKLNEKCEHHKNCNACKQKSEDLIKTCKKCRNCDKCKLYSKAEAIAYEYYTQQNNNKRIKTKIYKQYLSKRNQKIFKKLVKEDASYCKKTKTFNPLEYYKNYLNLDCLVLKKGLQKFKKIITKLTKGTVNLDDFLTISSLTDYYLKICGAYDGVYEVTGNTRAYISKAVYGGRVHVNEKYLKKVITKILSDFDGCSLYPSSENRLCREKGLPKGKAKRFNKDDLINWSKKDYSILTLKITKVNKIQQMPFIANKTDNGIEYSNNAPENEIVIDSYTLEDYINFHKIEYEILDGIYWDEGYNKKMGPIIKDLYNDRLKVKKTNPALANTIKLMLNSSYGKTITKTVKNKTKIVSQKYALSYIYNNFNTIRKYRELNKFCTEVEEIDSDYSYNRAHVGTSILSYSKRIMNEVFDIANTEKFPIYYTDTDSLHCDLKDVNKLNLAYFYKYKKALIGSNLEQFHTDFKLKNAATEIYSKKSIFLGKKSYIDRLESTDKNGNTINGYHIKLKGITTEGLEHACKNYDNNPFKMYTALAKGEKIKMILNPYNEQENSNKVLFEFKCGKVRTRNEFSRQVSF